MSRGDLRLELGPSGMMHGGGLWRSCMRRSTGLSFMAQDCASSFGSSNAMSINQIINKYKLEFLVSLDVALGEAADLPPESSVFGSRNAVHSMPVKPTTPEYP